MGQGESTVPVEESEPIPDPPAAEVIENLERHLGPEKLKAMVGELLRSTDRLQAVVVLNEMLTTVKLSRSADRGMMGRILAGGLERRHTPALEAMQVLTRRPFESEAGEARLKRLDDAVATLNRGIGAKGDDAEAERRRASEEIATVLLEVVDREAARRLLLFNAFPGTLDVLLQSLDARP